VRSAAAAELIGQALQRTGNSVAQSAMIDGQRPESCPACRIPTVSLGYASTACHAGRRLGHDPTTIGVNARADVPFPGKPAGGKCRKEARLRRQEYLATRLP